MEGTGARVLLLPAAIALLVLFLRSDGAWCSNALALQTGVPGCFLHPSASIADLSETERGIRIGGGGIPPRDILLSVPLKKIITPEYGHATPAGKAVRKKSRQSKNVTTTMMADNHTYLALWLCEIMAQREESNGAPLPLAPHIEAYLDTLPNRAAMLHLPVFWTEEELSELDGSQLKTDTLRKRAHWEALYQFTVDCFPPFERACSLDRFLWAKAVVHSRVFYLREEYFEDEGSNTERGIGLVPVADMLNHRTRSDPSTCDWRVEKDRRAFVIRASAKGLKPGSEACHSYGLHSNSHYLSWYGFAIEHNFRHDGATPDEAHIELFPEAADFSLQRSPLIALTIGDKKAATSLLSILRNWAATDSERSTMRRNSASAGQHESVESKSKPCDIPYSLRNERTAMEKIKSSVEHALARYKTSLEEDLALLGRNKEKKQDNTTKDYLPVGANRRNAILVRSGEKFVLRHWLALCDASLFCLGDVERGVTTWSQYCELLDATLERKTSIAA